MASKRDPSANDARAQARKQTDKEIKAKAAALKKRGLLYGSKDLRKTKVTPYMRKRVRELEGILTGDLVALKPPPGKKARDYKGRDDVKTTAGGRIIVENEPDTVQGFRGGKRSRVIPLKDGNNIEMIEVDADSRNLLDVIKYIEENESTLDKLKNPREKFAVRLNGLGNIQTFPNASALLFFLMRYKEQYESALSNGETVLDVHIYRVWPPGEWEAQILREQKENREARAFVRRVERERGRPNREPRFSPAELEAAKQARQVAYKERERLRKRAARVKTDDAARAKNAARMREKRSKK